MLKYSVVTAAMILAAPLVVSNAFAQSDAVSATSETTVSGDEAHHSENHDSTSTTSTGTIATHDAVESHSSTDNDASGGAVTSNTTDETHTTHTDDNNN